VSVFFVLGTTDLKFCQILMYRIGVLVAVFDEHFYGSVQFEPFYILRIAFDKVVVWLTL